MCENAAGAARFRYCLNTGTLRGKKLPLVETLEVTAKAGYDAIEPWIDEIDAYVREGGSLDDLRKRIADLGLSVEGAIGFFEWIVNDDGRRAKALVEARRCMELLAAIGGKRVAAPPSGATDRDDVDLWCAAERYRALLELGDEIGVTPIAEVWGFSKTLGRLGEAALVAIASGHPKACVLPDVYHLYKAGSGHATVALLSPAAMPVFHINDYPANPPRERIVDADRVYPGDGIAPLPALFADLRRMNYDGVLSLELFNEEYWREDALAIARTGLEKMRAAAEG